MKKTNLPLVMLCALGLMPLISCKKETPPPAPKPAAPPIDLDALKQKAGSGDPAAQTSLGKVYQEGTLVKGDVKEALKWYQLAAHQNYPDALAALGELTQAGLGVPANPQEAANLYLQAAEQGSVAGQYDLAYLYEQGTGVGKSETNAAKWYQLAAEGGDPLAQYDIGQRCMIGIGVSKNPIQAFKWLSLAAAQGQEDSIKLLKDLKHQMSDQDLAEANRQVNEFVPRKSNQGG